MPFLVRRPSWSAVALYSTTSTRFEISFTHARFFELFLDLFRSFDTYSFSESQLTQFIGHIGLAAMIVRGGCRVSDTGNATFAIAAWFSAGALAAGAVGVAFGFASGRRAYQLVRRIRSLERALTEFRGALRSRLEQERSRLLKDHSK